MCPLDGAPQHAHAPCPGRGAYGAPHAVSTTCSTPACSTPQACTRYLCQVVGPAGRLLVEGLRLAGAVVPHRGGADQDCRALALRTRVDGILPGSTGGQGDSSGKGGGHQVGASVERAQCGARCSACAAARHRGRPAGRAPRLLRDRAQPVCLAVEPPAHQGTPVRPPQLTATLLVTASRERLISALCSGVQRVAMGSPAGGRGQRGSTRSPASRGWLVPRCARTPSAPDRRLEPAQAASSSLHAWPQRLHSAARRARLPG